MPRPIRHLTREIYKLSGCIDVMKRKCLLEYDSEVHNLMINTQFSQLELLHSRDVPRRFVIRQF